MREPSTAVGEHRLVSQLTDILITYVILCTVLLHTNW